MWASVNDTNVNLTIDIDDKTTPAVEPITQESNKTSVANDSQSTRNMHKRLQNMRPYYIQLNSTLDFSRLVCALEHVPFMCMTHKYGDNQNILCAQTDMLQERPIIYYVLFDDNSKEKEKKKENDTVVSSHYLYYGFNRGKEEYGVTDIPSDTSMVYSPIVRIKSLPSVLQPDHNITDRYHSIALEDMSSLTKMAWGRGNATFPLFLFSHNQKWLLGATLAQASNANAPSYFTYVDLDFDPKKPYLMFSAQKGIKPTFVDFPSEHGYSYMKIIRLMNKHPLIDYDKI